MSAFASSLRPLMRTATGGALSARSFSSSSSRSVARMIITGRLAAAPELQATSSGQDVIRYTVATSTGARDNRQTSWFKVASFDHGAQRDYVLSLQKGYVVSTLFSCRAYLSIFGCCYMFDCNACIGKVLRCGANSDFSHSPEPLFTSREALACGTGRMLRARSRPL